jgi:hypothetical protein
MLNDLPERRVFVICRSDIAIFYYEYKDNIMREVKENLTLRDFLDFMDTLSRLTSNAQR